MMVDAHIHRIVVTDDDRSPVGIVTSTDILGAVARSTDGEESIERSERTRVRV
jgi:CBS domain-containing protein